ncbi:carbohydrate ABC transporter membrane protein 2, CUT1 family [Actinacidiphila yanglinensis]|uniref:Carbohydrate ABC transporter membrane protein 2, CUT1 family n=1 Tax=Actinacidiphila yanglinensis TaxID=310779 RepID=A0A1H6DZU4_9ACTN|nr:carbohydrate ABC transporter permease [Actinacidiphila yanglinensis]SEG90862.1 carbohydrate ABC transporter membrane protein 2, CUT1 family [Actinacidiphila yanglinensis]
MTVLAPERPRTAPDSALGRACRVRFSPGRAAAWLYIGVILLVTLFPFWWILRTALSDNVAMPTDPGSLLPVHFTWGAFERALGIAGRAQAEAQGGSGAAINTPLFLRNSLIYAAVQTTLVVFCSAMAAYAFARLRWAGRNLVFNILLGALMVPAILTLLPNFIFIRDIHQLNGFGGLILPGAFFSAFNIFFLRQFMLGLSTEVEEAATVDGAGRLRIFFTITLPMTAAPIATLSLLTFINTWNDYLWPLLVTSSDHAKPLTLALGVFKQSSPQAAPDWAGLMAATVIAALPMLALFMVFGRRIVNSIGFTGIK